MKSALSRVQRDDPTLTHLLLCEPSTTVMRGGPYFDMMLINSYGPELKTMFKAIGKNTHLRDICFDAPLGLSDAIASFVRPVLSEGLRRNTSIVSVGLSRCDLSRGVGKEVLKALEENGRNLTKLTFWRCAIRHEGPPALALTLARCTSLEEIGLSSCHVDDNMVEDLVRAVEGHRHLKALDLQENDIRTAGCERLAALLRGRDCSLVEIDLRKNAIDNAGAKALANALKNNDKVESIYLDENDISGEGWDAFTNVLCNPSSIIETYLSNHTLHKIHASNGGVEVAGRGLHHFLDLNAGRDKNRVTRRKILECHLNGDFDMEPFVDGNMETEVLPHLLGWVGKSVFRAGNFLQRRTVVFRLLRRMPALCAASSSGGAVAETQQRPSAEPRLTSDDVIDAVGRQDERPHAGRELGIGEQRPGAEPRPTSDDIIDEVGRRDERPPAGRKSRFGAILGTVRNVKKTKPFGKKETKRYLNFKVGGREVRDLESGSQENARGLARH